jgi:hypothetical protein
MLAASGNVIYANIDIAGPGTLEVSAGRNLYQADQGTLESIGPFVTGDTRPGASIVAQAGIGPGAPGLGQADYTDFAKLYFDPANQAVAGAPLGEQHGKVEHTYQKELLAWLQQRFGYTGGSGDALAYFLALPPEQQRVFDRQIYFAELNEAGLEYNDSASPLYGSYLRGRMAIAALFPNMGPNAQQGGNVDHGDITMFGGSGVRTDFGGAIQTLTPTGETIVGVEGQTPPATAGIVTQGTGDIDLYSDDSVLLGQSRVMTTFGGNILAWSATGDINAGRGSKNTIVFTPPKRVYDQFGNVTLSPTVPSTGAGFATLAPIPSVPPGDINLVAPLGTVDAGEAGIRVSGNINIAALHVVNADNIQVAGKTTGIPTTASVDTGALTAASSASSAASEMAQKLARSNALAGNQRRWLISVQVEGFGDSGAEDDKRRRKEKLSTLSYSADSALQVVGRGVLGAGDVARLSELAHLSAAERRSVEEGQ